MLYFKFVVASACAGTPISNGFGFCHYTSDTFGGAGAPKSQKTVNRFFLNETRHAIQKHVFW